MEFELGIEIIDTAYKQRTEERLFDRWLMYQNEMSFEEFKAKLEVGVSEVYVSHEKKSSDEVMNDVKRIVEAVHNGNI